MSELIKIPAEAKEVIKTQKNRQRYMLPKLILILMLLTPILTLLLMTLDKTSKSKLLKLLWARKQKNKK
jgi:hypothetical protein